MLNHYIFTCDELCIHLHTLSDGGIPQGFNWKKKDNFILYSSSGEGQNCLVQSGQGSHVGFLFASKRYNTS
jgi:hypothetical protein